VTSTTVTINPELRQYVGEKLAHLSQDKRRVMEPILLKYRRVVHGDVCNDFRGTDVIEHSIVTGEARPVRGPSIEPHMRSARS
jgi:hypothetical protein